MMIQYSQYSTVITCATIPHHCGVELTSMTNTVKTTIELLSNYITCTCVHKHSSGLHLENVKRMQNMNLKDFWGKGGCNVQVYIGSKGGGRGL